MPVLWNVSLIDNPFQSADPQNLNMSTKMNLVIRNWQVYIILLLFVCKTKVGVICTRSSRQAVVQQQGKQSICDAGNVDITVVY